MQQEEEINRVMEQYGASLYRMSYFVLGNEQDAQDVLQETMIKYLRKAPFFEVPEQEKAWLYRVANNLCRDMLRFRRRGDFVSLEALGDNGEEITYGTGMCFTISAQDSPDRQGVLRELIERLDGKLKKVIFLHYYEGYSVKEIAVILNISEAAVKKRLERGRKKLREKYEDHRLVVDK